MALDVPLDMLGDDPVWTELGALDEAEPLFGTVVRSSASFDADSSPLQVRLDGELASPAGQVGCSEEKVSSGSSAPLDSALARDARETLIGKARLAQPPHSPVSSVHDSEDDRSVAAFLQGDEAAHSFDQVDVAGDVADMLIDHVQGGSSGSSGAVPESKSTAQMQISPIKISAPGAVPTLKKEVQVIPSPRSAPSTTEAKSAPSRGSLSVHTGRVEKPKSPKSEGRPTVHSQTQRPSHAVSSGRHALTPVNRIPQGASEKTSLDGAVQTPANLSSTLKEKRAKEAAQFPREMLGSLEGTTSAEVRKMNAAERELVLYKRKLRNRDSARRSRQKRQATVAELQVEVDQLAALSTNTVDAVLELSKENATLRRKLDIANAQIRALKQVYPAWSDRTDESTAHKMKLGG